MYLAGYMQAVCKRPICRRPIYICPALCGLPRPQMFARVKKWSTPKKRTSTSQPSQTVESSFSRTGINAHPLTASLRPLGVRLTRGSLGITPQVVSRETGPVSLTFLSQVLGTPNHPFS